MFGKVHLIFLRVGGGLRIFQQYFSNYVGELTKNSLFYGNVQNLLTKRVLKTPLRNEIAQASAHVGTLFSADKES